MKIAIASENNIVSGHFGHCDGFAMYERAADGTLTKSFEKNPGHRPGFLPGYVKELGATVIISGGMGETAQMLFNEHGVEVVVGASGTCDDVVAAFLNGELESTGSVCRDHSHEGSCGQ